MTRTFAVLVVLLLTLTGCTTAHAPEATSGSTTPSTIESSTHSPAHEHEGQVLDEPDRSEPAEHVEHHHDPSQDDRTRAVQTSEAFLQGWLTPDLTLRRETLEPVTTPALVDAFDSPHYTPLNAAPSGATHLVHQTAFHITTRHRLTTGQIIELDLALEPDAHYGWIVTAIRER